MVDCFMNEEMRKVKCEFVGRKLVWPKPNLSQSWPHLWGTIKSFCCCCLFLRYVNRKRRTKENIGPLLDGEGHLTDKDIGKAETFNAFFASVFNTYDGLWDPGCPELDEP